MMADADKPRPTIPNLSPEAVEAIARRVVAKTLSDLERYGTLQSGSRL